MMANQSLSTAFPTEVQLLILRSLDAISLTRTRSTCKFYHDTINTDCNDLWKSLHDKKWPNGKRTPTRLRNENTTWSATGWMINHPSSSTATNNHAEGEGGDQSETDEFNFYNEFVRRARLDTTVLRRLMNLDITQSTENTVWFSLMQDGEDITDKIKSILTEQRQVPNAEICKICEIVLNGIARCVAYQEWKYLNEPGREANIEDGAIAISKFYINHDKIMQSNNMHSMEDYIKTMIGNMAKILQTRLNKRLGLANPNTPDPYSWRRQNGLVSPYPLMEVAEEMKVFFETGWYEGESIHPFTGNAGDYYNHKNSLIDCVLNTSNGIPITLAVIYTAIVRRACGVEFDIIGLPGHIVVGLPYEPGTPNSDRVFVDTFHKGKILSFQETQNIVQRYNVRFEDRMVQPISHQQVWQRMVRNLVQCHSMQALTEEGGGNANGDWKVAVPLRFFLDDLARNVNTFYQLVDAPGWCPRFC